jgi:tetratricopeptide (TPR) repeat protein
MKNRVLWVRIVVVLATGVLATGGLVACDPPRTDGPDPVLIADPPPTEDGRAPGAGTLDLDRGVAYLKKEAYEQAIPHLDKAIASQPDNAVAHYYLALAHESTGKVEEAEKGYKKAIELDDKLVNALVNLAALYLGEPPRPKQAIEVLKKAVAVEGQASDVHQNLAFAYRLDGNHNKAAAEYDQAIKLKDDPNARLAYADLLFEMGKHDAAATQMRSALPAFKKDLKKVVFLAHRFGKSKAYDDCVSAFTIAIGLNAKEPGFLLHRGLCQHSLKKENEARKDYNRALGIDAKFQPAHYYLGMSYKAAKKAGKAMFHFKQAEKIDRKSKVGKKATKQIKKMKSGR